MATQCWCPERKKTNALGQVLRSSQPRFENTRSSQPHFFVSARLIAHLRYMSAGSVQNGWEAVITAFPLLLLFSID